MTGSVMRLLLMLVLIAPLTGVVVAAWFGNSKPLVIWTLLCAVSAAGFLLGTRRAAARDSARDGSRTASPTR